MSNRISYTNVSEPYRRFGQAGFKFMTTIYFMILHQVHQVDGKKTSGYKYLESDYQTTTVVNVGQRFLVVSGVYNENKYILHLEPRDTINKFWITPLIFLIWGVSVNSKIVVKYK